MSNELTIPSTNIVTCHILSLRIVFVGSSLHLIAELDLDDLMLTKRGYFGIRNFGPYANSKLALLYFAKELAQRLSGSGVRVYTLCPGISSVTAQHATFEITPCQNLTISNPGYVKTDAFRNETCFNSAVTKTALFFAGVSPEEVSRINIIIIGQYCETQMYQLL